MTKQHIPKIRFQGFDEEWEKKKLDSILVERNEKTKINNEYQILSSTTKGIYLQEDYFNRQIASQNNIGYKIVKRDDVVISPQNLWLGNINLNTDYNIGIVSPSYKIFSIKNSDIFFQSNILKSDKMLYNYEQSSEQGASVVRRNLNMEEFYNINISLPSLPEQESIGQLFRTLDDLISAYKENLENYQNLKNSMLSKMFPKEGQKQPEIRLDGFEGDWEEKKLSELTEEIEYGLNVSSKSFDGVNKYLRITDIDDKYRNFIEDNLTSPDVDLTSLDSYLLKVGDILFARTGASVGKSYRYKISDGKVYFAGFLIRARIKKEYDVEFVYQNTLTARYYQYIKITSQRSGQPGVNGKEYGSFKIPLPSLSEQEAIGAFFANLDETISSYQDKIGQLELLKKRLLHNLFI